MRHNRIAAGRAKRAAMEAKELIYLGNPCRIGHEGFKYITNGRCIECAVSDALKQNEVRKIARVESRASTNY